MKTKSIILMLAVMVIAGMLSCKSKHQSNESIIKVVFTNQQTSADLDSIKENQKLKNLGMLNNNNDDNKTLRNKLYKLLTEGV